MSSLQKAKSLSLYPSSQSEDPNLFCSPWDSESNAQYASSQFINFLDLNLKYPNEVHKPAAILEEPSSEIPGIESYIQSLRRTQEVGLESPLSVDQPNVETIHNQVKFFKKKKYHAASQSHDRKKRGSAHDISHNEDADTNATSPGFTFDSKETDPTFLTLSKSFKKDLSPSESRSKATNKQPRFRKHRPLTGGGNRYPTREASGSQRSLNSHSYSQKAIFSRETSPSHQNDVGKMHTQSIKLLLKSRAKEESFARDPKVLFEDNNKSSMPIENSMKISRFSEISFPGKKEKLKRAFSSKQVSSSVKKSLNISNGPTMVSSHTFCEAKNQSNVKRVFNASENVKNSNFNVVVGGFVRQSPMRKRGEMNVEDYLTTILETSTNYQKDIVKSIEFTNHIWNKHKNEYGSQAPLLKSMKKQIEGRKILDISSNKRAESPDSIFANKRPATAKANVRGISMSISSPTSKWDSSTPSDLNNEHYIKNMFSSVIEKKIVDRSKSRSNMEISRLQRPATAAVSRNDRSRDATNITSSAGKEESNLSIKDRIVKKGTSESVLWTLKTNLLKCFPEPNKEKDRVVVTFKRRQDK